MKQCPICSQSIPDNQKYCSPKCVGFSQRRGKWVQCANCGKTFYAKRRLLKLEKAKYCSSQCHPMYQSGAKHTNWSNGKKMTSDGYVEIYRPDHPGANRGGYVFEHRFVMENYIGRYLQTSERVHHADGNKANNDINNLMLFQNESEHKKHHHKIGTYLRVY